MKEIRLCALIAGFLMAIPGLAHAQCAVPYQLTNGQTADATQVMADLDALLACVNTAAPGGSLNAVQYNAGNGSFGGIGPLTNGQLIIGATGSAPQAAALTAGANVTITNTPGSITISAAGGGGGSLNPRGAWSGTASYNPGDVVTYNGSAYVCYIAVSAPGSTTWNPSDATSDISLSNSNLTAQHTSNSYGGVRSTSSQSSGKYYFEINVGNLGGNYTGVGIANAAAALTSPIGSDTSHSGIGLWSIGSIEYGGQTVASGYGLRGNNQIAVDLGNKLFWIRGNGDAWNYNSSADPASGTGGIDISALLNVGNPFAAIISQSSGEYFTINPGPSGFTGTVPAGFTAGWPGGAANTSPDQDAAHWLSQGNVNAIGANEGDIAYFNGVGNGWATLPAGTSGQVLETQGAGSSPAWAPPTSLLDSLGSPAQGDILYRGGSNWQLLAPGTSGQVLASQGANANPQWVNAGGGLYNQVMSATPTSAGTGLTNWVNQGTATQTDGQTGMVIHDSSQSSATLRILSSAAPAAPYTITALLAVTGSPTNSITGGIGWYDGSSKVEDIGLVYTNGWVLSQQEWNSPTSYNTSSAATNTGNVPLVWLQIQDDGTNVYERFSYDGVSFITLFTIAKSSGWLGASGYSNIIFFTNPQGAETYATLMSWTQH